MELICFSVAAYEGIHYFAQFWKCSFQEVFSFLTLYAFKELFDSLKNSDQNNLESMKGSEFVFGYIHLLYYKCHK